MKKNIIRAGDRVEVITPKYVKRVGYPKCIKDYRGKAEEMFLPILREKLNYFPSYPKDKLLDEIAYIMLARDGFGGTKRDIHFEEDLTLLNKQFTVYNIRSVKTGTYQSGYGSSYNYYGENDYEPAYLAVDKVHRLATVNGFTLFSDKKLEIPTYFLKKVDK